MFDAFTTLTILGMGFWGSLIFLGLGLALLVYGYQEKGWGNFAVVFLGILVFAFMGDWRSAVANIQAHPWVIVKYVASYVIIGVAWSLLKWMSYTRAYAKVYSAFKAKYELNNGLKVADLTGQPLADFKETVINRFGPIPSISNKADDLLYWMTYWPVSMVWFMLRNPVQWLMTHIMDLVSEGFKYVSNFILREVRTDFERK